MSQLHFVEKLLGGAKVEWKALGEVAKNITKNGCFRVLRWKYTLVTDTRSKFQ